jgi:hypothetical protein
MNRTKSGVDFFNVPKPHIFDNPPEDLICDACGNVNEHPINVFACHHSLCAACWQKSAYNFWGNKNECLICKAPTDLVCYRDYWRFIGKNIFAKGCYVEHDKCLALDKLVMYCNVEGCDYKAKRPDVQLHEKECWRLKRSKQLEAAKSEEIAAAAEADQAPPCPQLESAPQDPEAGSAPFTQFRKPVLSFQIPSTPVQEPVRKYIRRK